MNAIESSIDKHVNSIQEMYKDKKCDKGCIWYIIIDFNDSVLHGPFYMERDSEMLSTVLSSDFSKLRRHVSDKNITLCVCYYDCPKKINMFEYYQMDKKWIIISFPVFGKHNIFSKHTPRQTPAKVQ